MGLPWLEAMAASMCGAMAARSSAVSLPVTLNPKAAGELCCKASIMGRDSSAYVWLDVVEEVNRRTR